jgi:hypothetical protein
MIVGLGTDLCPPDRRVTSQSPGGPAKSGSGEEGIMQRRMLT